MIKKTVKHIVSIVTALAILASFSPDASAATESYSDKNFRKSYIFNARSACTLNVHVDYFYTQTKNYYYITSIGVTYQASEAALDEIDYMPGKPYFTNKDGSVRTAVKFEHPTELHYGGNYLDDWTYYYDYYWSAKNNSERIKVKKDNNKCKINCVLGAYCAESYFWLPKITNLDGTVTVDFK